MTDGKTGGPLGRQSRTSNFFERVASLLKVYTYLGSAIALLGAGYFGLTLVPNQLTPKQTEALNFSVSGFALAVISQVAIAIFKERRKAESLRYKEYAGLGDFLEAWSRFELISKHKMINDNESFDRHSLRSVISKLRRDYKINDSDVKALESALQARNAIVHAGQRLTLDRAESLTKSVREITDKVERSIGTSRRAE
jgi:hypothetical protein